MSRPFSPLVRARGLLADAPALAVLLPEARRLADLNRLFARRVSAGMARACRVAGLEGENAVVYCSHGAAAARLRSQAGTVAKAIGAAGLTITGLKVKVRADWAVPDRKEKAGMGAAALDAWGELAADLPEGELKAAVGRLLQHQKKGPEAKG